MVDDEFQSAIQSRHEEISKIAHSIEELVVGTIFKERAVDRRERSWFSLDIYNIMEAVVEHNAQTGIAQLQQKNARPMKCIVSTGF